ncbi:hypothetical protein AB0H77_29130, partial [Streptomyces sp. NPDC050844]|uniref:hypothetical protein n=1 Tax=Streptomyces sp. NPDC050844 TaxID=3155790 RepID=UPI0033CEA943
MHPRNVKSEDDVIVPAHERTQRIAPYSPQSSEPAGYCPGSRANADDAVEDKVELVAGGEAVAI